MKLQDIADQYNLDDLAKEYGVILKGYSSKWGICPFPNHIHQSNTPSFSIFFSAGRQKFKCHGSCGAWGDAIDFIGFMHIPFYDGSDIEKRQKAAQLLMSNRLPSVEPVRVKPKPNFIPEFIWTDLQPLAGNVRTYSRKRGINEELSLQIRISDNNYARCSEKEGMILSDPNFPQ